MTATPEHASAAEARAAAPAPNEAAAPEPTTHPRSRRALLAGLAGGAGALVATALGRVPVVRGVVANPMLLGTTNDAGSATTRLDSASGGANSSFWVANSESGTAIKGVAVRGNGGQFRTSVNNKFGLIGVNAAATAGSGAAVQAAGKHNTAVLATTDEPSRYAIDATNSGSGTAVNASGNPGVWAQSAIGNALIGISTASGSVAGVFGQSTSTTGSALSGYASASSGANRGVYAGTNSPTGRAVLAVNPYGATPISLSERIAVQGHSTATGEAAMGVTGSGVASGSQDAWGVYGYASTESGTSYGVYGSAASTSGTTYAGYFNGNVDVLGTIVKTSGSFKIDHPLDPANKYLYHSFVESPDMMNVYNGNVTTDAKGEATVSLPDWFEALNADFRYQLTAIGSFARAMVKSKVKANRFVIATSEPNVEVSWQVTGIRHDAYAEAHRIEVEVAKSGKDKGKYLHPVEHGRAAADRIAPL